MGSDWIPPEKTIAEVAVTVFVGVLVVFGLVIALVPLMGCATPRRTHEEWAAYCMSKESAEFVECLRKWNEWEKL